MYYEAYVLLTTCRTEKGCVPWTALAQYAHMHEYDTDQLDDLVYYAGEMDAEYLSWSDSQDKNKSGIGARRNGAHPKRVR